ncbi:MAG: hypothetical protein CBC47_03765 [Alphaproteobacteria bacterium TMED87]|nr:MarR family transcriptional regulator [Rhodospirillaceae bacterium]OUV10220.1 MAG: hypothetical protein CBC47_03765 [Alphaproteobacteria bacterium TMED87]
MAVRRQDALGYQIGLLNRLFDRMLEIELLEFNVSPGQYPSLIMLFEEDGLTQADLCRRIHVEQPTMANTLKRMERDGLIRREPDSIDKRQTRIFLTHLAKNIKLSLIEKARTVPETAMKGLNNDEKEKFFALMSKLIENLNEKLS